MIDRLRAWGPRLLPWIALALAAVAVGGGNAYILTVGTVTVIWAMLALGLNVIMGYSGLINLGLGAFYALGAYGAGILATEHDVSPWIGLIGIPIVALAIALVIGPAVLRTRGLHFAVATLGIGIIVSDVLENWISVTKGPIGIPGVERPGKFGVAGIQIDPATSKGFFALSVLLLFVVIAVAAVYHRSRLARILVATRDDDLLTRSLGFSVTPPKVLAFAMSAAIAAFAGVVYAWFIRYVSPPPFSFFAASFPAFVLVAVGGPGTVWGPIVGAIFLTGYPEFLDLEPHTQLIVYGLVLLAVVVLMPKGLAPTVAGWTQQAVNRLRGAPPVSVPAASSDAPSPIDESQGAPQ